MIVKTTAESFCRDTDSHALINTNREAYKLYKSQRGNTNAVSSLEQEVVALKDDMHNIKKMLQQLLDRDNSNVS